MWSSREYGQVFREIRKKRKRLGVLNKGGRAEAQVNERKKVVREINALLHLEEIYWRQRSRALWLESGDRNTNFFHRKASQRRSKNRISHLVTDDGVTHVEKEQICFVANDYCKTLFTSSLPSQFDEALAGIDTRVTSEMNSRLCAPYTADEVFLALKQMHPLKDPGRMSAFTPGRLITDNILVAFELFYHMKNSGSESGFLALKLDMAKAYDRVEWSFLRAVMIKFGFAEQWVDRVIHCISTVSFSVLINGAPSGEFTPSRGLRQGDPLSPYLFILCAEALSGLLNRAVALGHLHGIRVAPLAPTISHLFFADDSIIFAKANLNEVDTIREVLHTYEIASGQMVNFGKTTVTFSKGVPVDRREDLANALRVNIVDVHDKYLGLPTVVGRSKRVITKDIREKLWKRLQGWKGGYMCKAGRKVLIKAVAQSIPTYAMSVFKFPSSFCDELRSMVANFWWRQKNGERKIHWVAWKKLCEPKASGGLGFRDFKAFNAALLGKQAWRLIQFPDSLVARVLKARYFAERSYLDAELGNMPSYTWRGIWSVRWVVQRGLRWRVGDGCSIPVWKCEWIPGTQSRRVITPRGSQSLNLKVCDLIHLPTASWNVPKVKEIFLPFEQECILSIPLSVRVLDDTICWDLEKGGDYKVRSAYRAIFGDYEADFRSSGSSSLKFWGKMWAAVTLPRVKVFFWRACRGALPTLVGLNKRIPGKNTTCSVCGLKTRQSYIA
ncbi:uncharacterized protein LOC110703671 [Chenopodium quinoa]|uniref:uncharacterized protein LOC110703671 n=1 Tax=Chenopodium quinoa TaxID=63459 RepID=UPI000B77E749|nr:uncharacterized protein LOC110703671 [Chenopodium quinoa]